MKIRNEINQQTLPIFILFKNLQFQDESHTFDIDEIKSGEIIACDADLSQLTELVPSSIYPSVPDKQQLFEGKYGDREDVDFSFNTSPYALIDIDPEDVERMADFDIFGESYIILWVCPPNIDEIVKSLIQHTKQTAKINNKTLGDVIYTIWDEYINNISIYSDDKEIDTFDIIYNVKKEYEKQLNQLPDKPTQSDWDFIEEMASK